MLKELYFCYNEFSGDYNSFGSLEEAKEQADMEIDILLKEEGKDFSGDSQVIYGKANKIFI